MSLDLYYHKKHEYIWFGDVDLNGVRDIILLMKWKGWGFEWFLKYETFHEVGWREGGAL